MKRSSTWVLLFCLLSGAALAAEAAPATIKAKVLRPAEGSSWSVLPRFEGGMARDFAMQGKLVYAGTDYGLFQSADGGATWTPEELPAVGSVSSAATDDAVWAAVDSKRLFKKGKAGVWEELTEALCKENAGEKDEDGKEKPCSVDLLAGKGKTLLIGTSRGIYQARADGFVRIREENECDFNVVFDGAAFYCNRGPKLTRQQGKAVSSIAVPVDFIQSFAADGKRLYLLGSKFEAEGPGPVLFHVSIDGGKRWTVRKTPTELGRLFGHKGALYADAGDDVVVSRDDGKSWQVAFKGGCASGRGDLGFGPTGPLRACNEGVRRWDAKAREWRLGRGILAAVVKQLEAGPHAVFAQTDADLHRCTPTGCQRIADAKGFLAASPEGALVTSPPPGISFDEGASFTTFAELENTMVQEVAGGADGLVFHARHWLFRLVEGKPAQLPLPPKTKPLGDLVLSGPDLFVATSEWDDTSAVLHSVDGGKSWTQLFADGTRMLNAMRADGRFLYGLMSQRKSAANAPVLWRSVRVAGEWSAPVGLEAPAGALRELVVRGSQLWLLGEEKIYESVDRGETWRGLEVEVPKRAADLAVVDGHFFLKRSDGSLMTLRLVEQEVEVPAEPPDRVAQTFRFPASGLSVTMPPTGAEWELLAKAAAEPEAWLSRKGAQAPRLRVTFSIRDDQKVDDCPAYLQGLAGAGKGSLETGARYVPQGYLPESLRQDGSVQLCASAGGRMALVGFDYAGDFASDDLLEVVPALEQLQKTLAAVPAPVPVAPAVTVAPAAVPASTTVMQSDDEPKPESASRSARSRKDAPANGYPWFPPIHGHRGALVEAQLLEPDLGEKGIGAGVAFEASRLRASSVIGLAYEYRIGLGVTHYQAAMVDARVGGGLGLRLGPISVSGLVSGSIDYVGPAKEGEQTRGADLPLRYALDGHLSAEGRVAIHLKRFGIEGAYRRSLFGNLSQRETFEGTVSLPLSNRLRLLLGGRRTEMVWDTEGSATVTAAHLGLGF